MRRVLLVALCGSLMALAGGVVVAPPAAAVPPERNTFQDSVTFVIDAGDLCSFPLRVSEQARGTELLFFNDQGDIVRRKVVTEFTGTWTGLDSGKSLIERETFVNIDKDNTFSVIGLNWHFRLPSGGTVVIDVGRILVDATTFEILFESGKHQVIDNGLEVICHYLS